MKTVVYPKTLLGFVVLIAATTIMVSCGGTSTPTQGTLSHLKHRAFISNPFQASGSGSAPLLNIVDASNDKLTNFFVSVGSSSPQPTLMAVSPNRHFLMVYSVSNNAVALVDTQTEAIAQSGTQAVRATTLSGNTESILFSADNATGYAAVPTATVTGQNVQGAVQVMSLFSGQVSANVPVTNARYLLSNATTSRLVVFSDGSDTVTEVATSLIGTSTSPLSSVSGFDRPVGGILDSNDTTLYVFNCGVECGGTAAGIQIFDVNSEQLVGSPIPVPGGATAGLLSGTTLYVAGSTPGTLCTATTAATSCGTLSVVDLNTKTVTATFEITDGYHTHLELGSKNRLFVGARNCSNVVPANSAAESRGCLAIFDTVAATTPVVPRGIGDVTSIQAVPDHDRVYVNQGGTFRVYDTNTLITPPPGEEGTVAIISGRPYDIKILY